MIHKVLVTVEVEVHADKPLDLRMALAELRRRGFHVDQTTVGHTGDPKRRHAYCYGLKSTRGAKVEVAQQVLR